MNAVSYVLQIKYNKDQRERYERNNGLLPSFDEISHTRIELPLSVEMVNFNYHTYAFVSKDLKIEEYGVESFTIASSD